jgi:Putative collagen-binding domain of a collagenase
VQHTFPPHHNKNKIEKPNFDYYYLNLVGFQSELTGASLQLMVGDQHTHVKRWVELSEKAGKPWVVCNDEQGGAGIGVTVDSDYPTYTGKNPDNANKVRHEVLWATFLVGGAGIEYYYGYQTEANDLNAQDHRTRAHKYEQAKIAIDFLQKLPFWEMRNMDDLTTATDDYVFGKEGEVYVVYLPKSGTTSINLPSGKWQVQWFNPRTGGDLSSKTGVKGSISAPNTEGDWVALLKKG